MSGMRTELDRALARDPVSRPEFEAARIRRDTEPCGWCGGKKCDGETQAQPHHSLCCLDRAWAPCWGPRRDDLAIEREDRWAE